MEKKPTDQEVNQQTNKQKILTLVEDQRRKCERWCSQGKTRKRRKFHNKNLETESRNVQMLYSEFFF